MSVNNFSMQTTILDTPYNLSLLSELGLSETHQPKISQLIESLYGNVFGTIVDRELAQEKVALKTRMYKETKEGVYRGRIIKKKQKVVVADVLRGGIQPANLFYLKLCELLDPKYVRQDHIMSQRIETKEGVIGTNLMGSKIGGSIKDAVVFIPDCMGATGFSMVEVINHYLEHYSTPKKFVVVNLIATPTYIARLRKAKADVSLYVLRKDKKLTKGDFIVPGLGGVGELINNTKK